LEAGPDRRIGYPDPTLSDDRVVLRPWSMDDLACIEQASSDTRIPEGTTVPAVYTPEEGRAFVERQWSRQTTGYGLSMAIADVATNEAVGLIVLMNRPAPGTAALGYWIVPAARSQGRGTRAIRLLSRWTLAEAGMARLEARVMPDNEPSLRALRRCGFVTEGVLRSHLYLHGRHYDMVGLSLIPSDLE
jgi:RimJ/RimL family protein N-acetyltransferase